MALAHDHPQVIAKPPLIFLAFILVGVLLNTAMPITTDLIRWPRLIGTVIIVSGLWLSARCVLLFLRHETHPDPGQPTTKIITEGPFRRSRNPVYLAFALMHLGVGVWIANVWVMYTVLLAMATIHFGVVLREERYLSEKFGEEYERYRNSVRRWL